MTLEELRTTMIGWLNEIKEWWPATEQNWEDYFQFENEDAIRLKLYTDNHVYRIYAKEGYLAAGVTNRKWRPGEDWHRSNNLPDGKFSKATWDAIIRGILSYELVAKVKSVEPIADTPPISIREK